MTEKPVKVYTYTRVSTSMQVDGYSLDAQKESVKRYADAFGYHIVGEYQDAGKSGKSISGRMEFMQMLEDIASRKDDVSYVLVFKLSRFGRNAADTLSSLQTMQDYGVNLISVQDGLDSSKETGKLIITIVSSVAEMERENILSQTMEGRKQKAREGKWNGGFAPYGYKLERGNLYINEEEAVAIRIIFDKYANTAMGANGVAKYMLDNDIRKVPRGNGNKPYFDAHLVRAVLENPIYNGRIAFGRRKTEKVPGTRDKYRPVKQDMFEVHEGVHEAIIDDDTWNKTQAKRKKQSKKYERVNLGKKRDVHLLSGILRCPKCGDSLYGYRSRKKKKDGTYYADYNYYACKHRLKCDGVKCDFKKQINKDLLEKGIEEIIGNLISKPHFVSLMNEKIDLKTDTVEIEKEIERHRRSERQYQLKKEGIANEIDNLDIDDVHYNSKYEDLKERHNKMYDLLFEVQSKIEESIQVKEAMENDKFSKENIFKILSDFKKVYSIMEKLDRKRILNGLIDYIEIYEAEQPNGQWFKKIRFNLPIMPQRALIFPQENKQDETVVLLQKTQTAQ